MKAYEFLATLNSHDIYDSDELGVDFKKQTGLEPCWGGATPAQTMAAIEKRGLGGTLNASAGQRLVSGWEMAEAVSEKYANGKSHNLYQGRGRRFNAAIEDLKKADV